MNLPRQIGVEKVAAAIGRRIGGAVQIIPILQRCHLRPADNEFVWYWLSVNGELVGRRETLDELLELAEKGKACARFC